MKDGTGQQEGEEEEEVRVLHPLSYMSGNLKKKMEEVLGCRFLIYTLTILNVNSTKCKDGLLGPNPHTQ